MRSEGNSVQDFLATIYSSYKIIEKYLAWLASSSTNDHQPEVLLKPIDVYLMGQVIECYSIPPLVIDLAADSTMGASTVLWASHPHVHKIIIPQSGVSSTKNNLMCKEFLQSFKGELGLGERQFFTDIDTDREIKDGVTPVLSLCAVADRDVKEVNPKLEYWFTQYPDANLFLLPLGSIGKCLLLEQLLEFCSVHPSYRLSAVREISPFLASSQLALLKRFENINHIMVRFRQLFDGNFQFVSLAETIVNSTMKLLQQERQLLECTSKLQSELREKKKLKKELIAEKELTRNLTEQIKALEFQTARKRSVIFSPFLKR